MLDCKVSKESRHSCGMGLALSLEQKSYALHHGICLNGTYCEFQLGYVMICVICVLYIDDILCDFFCPKLQHIEHNESFHVIRKICWYAIYILFMIYIYIYISKIFVYIHIYVFRIGTSKRSKPCDLAAFRDYASNVECKIRLHLGSFFPWV